MGSTLTEKGGEKDFSNQPKARQRRCTKSENFSPTSWSSQPSYKQLSHSNASLPLTCEARVIQNSTLRNASHLKQREHRKSGSVVCRSAKKTCAIKRTAPFLLLSWTRTELVNW